MHVYNLSWTLMLITPPLWTPPVCSPSVWMFSFLSIVTHWVQLVLSMHMGLESSTEAWSTASSLTHGENEFFFPQQLSIPSSPQLGSLCCSHPHWKCSHAGNHCFCGFMRAMAMPCPGDSLLQHRPILSLSFLPCLPQCSLSLWGGIGGDIDFPFRVEHSVFT